jgi:glucan phosphoethanolaminetransferase (alkaline phosphatase superfamily)
MWQRIQTVFLLIAIISLIAAIIFPIWVYQDAFDQTHKLFAFHYSITSKNGKMITEYFPYCLTAILAIAAITISIIEIRKYRDRVLQMKLGALNSLFLAGTIASAFIFSNQLSKEFQGGQFGLGLWLPGIAVLCNLLANRFIRRDEKLVRDSNRLR